VADLLLRAANASLPPVSPAVPEGSPLARSDADPTSDGAHMTDP
jgi:hypothetical protein